MDQEHSFMSSNPNRLFSPYPFYPFPFLFPPTFPCSFPPPPPPISLSPLFTPSCYPVLLHQPLPLPIHFLIYSRSYTSGRIPVTFCGCLSFSECSNITGGTLELSGKIKALVVLQTLSYNQSSHQLSNRQEYS